MLQLRDRRHVVLPRLARIVAGLKVVEARLQLRKLLLHLLLRCGKLLAEAPGLLDVLRKHGLRGLFVLGLQLGLLVRVTHVKAAHRLHELVALGGELRARLGELPTELVPQGLEACFVFLQLRADLLEAADFALEVGHLGVVLPGEVLLLRRVLRQQLGRLSRDVVIPRPLQARRLPLVLCRPLSDAGLERRLGLRPRSLELARRLLHACMHGLGVARGGRALGVGPLRDGPCYLLRVLASDRRLRRRPLLQGRRLPPRGLLGELRLLRLLLAGGGVELPRVLAPQRVGGGVPLLDGLEELLLAPLRLGPEGGHERGLLRLLLRGHAVRHLPDDDHVLLLLLPHRIFALLLRAPSPV
mmetsp:Transcript_42003/g.134096  ORF Transcript_42003/g.134096 Transcript_42003/m.134096 type:complete len:357 (-) Transcript_42003:1217-2287(-)